MPLRLLRGLRVGWFRTTFGFAAVPETASPSFFSFALPPDGLWPFFEPAALAPAFAPAFAPPDFGGGGRALVGDVGR